MKFGLIFGLIVEIQIILQDIPVVEIVLNLHKVFSDVMMFVFQRSDVVSFELG
jgi:hypothetical protein